MKPTFCGARFSAVGRQHGDYALLTKGNCVAVTEYAAATDVLPGLHMSLLRTRP